jgi:spore coat polysaccharide biosynthesis protein SpsF
MELKIVVITQARIGSTRLPGKVLKRISGHTLLGIHLERIKRSKLASKVCVATTFEDGVDAIVKIAKDHDCDFHQGSTDDVLDRYYQAAKKYDPDLVVRLTSDCPLIDPDLLDALIQTLIDEGVDYLSNAAMSQYPDGQDMEVMKFSALKTAWENARLKSEREHVTPYIRNHGDGQGEDRFKLGDYPSTHKLGHIRMTVDEPEDFEAVELLVQELGTKKTWLEYANFIMEHPDRFHNQQVKRNEGYEKSLSKDNTDN